LHLDGNEYIALFQQKMQEAKPASTKDDSKSSLLRKKGLFASSPNDSVLPKNHFTSESRL
jgi:hypothetical protein